ncbi:type IV toxin-antitoxin system AbiEi family antitoxin [Arcanobacterium haemolyticum]|uniref:type IV toxin-antitoxin system AbiEi family antitoxin n=1 Tax=Arcanobacterium haemolyticum TaxID=28264 RepID=UPI0036F3A68F
MQPPLESAKFPCLLGERVDNVTQTMVVLADMLASRDPRQIEVAQEVFDGGLQH